MVLVNMVFWFLTAPDPRFIHGVLMVSMALSVSLLASRMKFLVKNYQLINKRLAFAAIFIVVLFTIDEINLLIKKHIVLPRPYIKGKVETVQGTNFEYNIPAYEKQCYNADLPCGEKEIKNIGLRGEGLADGFKIFK